MAGSMTKSKMVMTTKRRHNQTRSKLFNVVFGMPKSELFTADDVLSALDSEEVSISAIQVEKQLKRWSDAGKLMRIGGYYSIPKRTFK